MHSLYKNNIQVLQKKGQLSSWDEFFVMEPEGKDVELPNTF